MDISLQNVLQEDSELMACNFNFTKMDKDLVMK